MAARAFPFSCAQSARFLLLLARYHGVLGFFSRGTKYLGLFLQFGG